MEFSQCNCYVELIIVTKYSFNLLDCLELLFIEIFHRSIVPIYVHFIVSILIRWIILTFNYLIDLLTEHELFFVFCLNTIESRQYDIWPSNLKSYSRILRLDSKRFWNKGSNHITDVIEIVIFNLIASAKSGFRTSRINYVIKVLWLPTPLPGYQSFSRRGVGLKWDPD